MSDLLTRITIDPNRMHGRPCIRDLRITVGDILGLLSAGQKPFLVRQFWSPRIGTFRFSAQRVTAVPRSSGFELEMRIIEL
jgi:hypothetical protein